MKYKVFLVVFILIFVFLATFFFLRIRAPQRQDIPFFQPSQEAENIPDISLMATNLEIPWSLVFLPNRDALFTERPGRVRAIDAEGNLNPDPLLVIDDVEHIGEGGLLGLEIHPNFNSNPYVYLYYTYREGNQILNRVVRYLFSDGSLSQREVILEAIPGSVNHNGGRIKFGPDGYLYITTGDTGSPSLSQNRNSLAGKILRLTNDGNTAPDNPFGNAVFSYGHRNPQGLVWDNEGRLWSTEHGPSANDELNLIERGGNYGWPTIQGEQEMEGMITPVASSGQDTWAPSGAVFYNGSVFFTGLRGQALYQAKLSNALVEIEEHFKEEFGRIRDIILGPDGFFYLLTNNRDGRGRSLADDDRIIRINPEALPN